MSNTRLIAEILKRANKNNQIANLFIGKTKNARVSVGMLSARPILLEPKTKQMFTHSLALGETYPCSKTKNASVRIVVAAE